MNTLNLTILLIIWNCITFLIYGIDKFLAKQNMWRISEKTLITIAFAGGGVGAFLGMRFFRHKTKHTQFVMLLPIALIVTIIIFAVINKA